MIENLPRERGSYALWLALGEAVSLSVGRLGAVDFPRGDYLYLGSARGSGGLRARLRHHLLGGGAAHWHVDYLRRAAAPRGVLYAVSDAPLECAWSQALGGAVGAVIPARKFGAADCRLGCCAHLVCFPAGINPRGVRALLEGVGQTGVIFVEMTSK